MVHLSAASARASFVQRSGLFSKSLLLLLDGHHKTYLNHQTDKHEASEYLDRSKQRDGCENDHQHDHKVGKLGKECRKSGGDAFTLWTLIFGRHVRPRPSGYS